MATGLPSSALVDLGLKIVGTRYSAGVSAIVTGSYVDYGWNWAVNPADGKAWEKSDIDGLQSSLLSVGLVRATLRCTQVYLTVTYTPPPPAGGAMQTSKYWGEPI